MKVLMQMVALVLVLGLVGMTYGQATQKAEGDKAATLKGKITKVDGANVTVTVKSDAGDAKDVVVKTDAKTAVIVDKVEGKKVSDLVVGMSVTVTPADGVATEIKAKTPKAKAAGDGSPAAPKEKE